MKKSIIVLFFLVITSLVTIAQPNNAVQQYVNKYKELAIAEEMRTGVPASITLAQGILETQAGQSDLCIASNNHFGIKCKSEWTGATVYHDDDTKAECFRSYPTVEDSYRDHSDFLKNRPNYAPLFSIDPTDYVSWAYGLKKAGYATSPVYANMLVKIINDNNLQSFTYLAIERMKNGNSVVVNNIDQSVPVSNTALNVSHVGASPDNLETSNTAQPAVPVMEYAEGSYPSGTFTINGTKVMYAASGTSLFALASNSGISYAKLLEFNELDKTDILDKDQLIYLEKKLKKSAKDYHTVTAGETIEAIAQKEGVQLESLFEYNKMQKGLEPAAGEKIYLHSGKQSYYPKLLARNNSK